jgi:hypothetical protein
MLLGYFCQNLYKFSNTILLIDITCGALIEVATHSSLKSASEDFYREVRKLEVRLDDYLQDEETFVNTLRKCIVQFKSLHTSIEELTTNSNTQKINEALQLKTISEEAFSQAVINEGKAEHERSHLLESYGALFLALQKLQNDLKASKQAKTSTK